MQGQLKSWERRGLLLINRNEGAQSFDSSVAVRGTGGAQSVLFIFRFKHEVEITLNVVKFLIIGDIQFRGGN